MTEPTNAYTRAWFKSFMDGIAAEQTESEIRGLARWLPLPAYRAVLDVCCGTGRHAARLAALGYAVTGIDRDPIALAEARRCAPGACFVELDQRHVGCVGGPYDAAVILWQSFGYFDAAGNDDILWQIAALLRPGGRLALDLFHPGYFAAHQGRRTNARPGVAAITDTIAGSRLLSEIEYADGTRERMDFELFTLDDLAARAAPFGFAPVGACCWWNEHQPPDPKQARYQIIFELNLPTGPA